MNGYAAFAPGIIGTATAPSFFAEVPPGALAALTPRERDVLSEMGTGASNRAIAESRGLTEGTVCNYVTRILSQLGLTSRTQAALFAGSQVDEVLCEKRRPCCRCAVSSRTFSKASYGSGSIYLRHCAHLVATEQGDSAGMALAESYHMKYILSVSITMLALSVPVFAATSPATPGSAMQGHAMASHSMKGHAMAGHSANGHAMAGHAMQHHMMSDHVSNHMAPAPKNS